MVPTRRGAALIGFAVAAAGLLAASATSFLLVVATQGKQSAYERHAIQALYAAEAGVETALALRNAGGTVAEGLHGTCGDATWELGVAVGRTLEVTGTVKPRLGAVVQRRVRVTLAERGGRVCVASWERVPVPVAKVGVEGRPAVLQPGKGEERQ